ncbi:MAG: GNAT family N-acetyltransferase [Candidatus Hermodarchaeota archaeon]
MRFVQIYEQDFPNNKKVLFHYTSEYYYEINLVKKANNEGWIFDWTKKKFSTMFEKKTEGVLFEDYKVNAEYYIAIDERKEELGILVIAKQDWNNTLRIWDIYVMAKYQRKGIGTQLMNFAKERAKTWGCRALVVECQSSNYPAIQFYLKNGLDLTGFDLLSYSNEDVKKCEVRLEMTIII